MSILAIISAAIGILKSVIDIFRPKKREAIEEANQEVSEARQGQAHSDTEVAVLKAESKKMQEDKESLEEIKSETEY